MKNKQDWMSKRRATYCAIANELSLLNDAQLSKLLATSTSIGSGIGGSSALLKISDVNVFIKKIRLTGVERLPENIMSTANLFKLPLYYQYGVGSTGFGAWRELVAHIVSTNWIISDQCLSFPLLYHWRVLPSNDQEPSKENLEKLEKDVSYWNNSSAIRSRLEANLKASENIVLFLEYFPENLNQWLSHCITQKGTAIESACSMIESDLINNIEFMGSQGFLHFDVHFHNILTDGNHLYFSDFGLATSSKFELSEEEIKFFRGHADYDRYSAFTNFLHCLVTHYCGKEQWIESLNEVLENKKLQLPACVMSIIKRYAPVALLMDKFYRELQRDKTTEYPNKALEQAWINRD